MIYYFIILLFNLLSENMHFISFVMHISFLNFKTTFMIYIYIYKFNYMIFVKKKYKKLKKS